MPDIMARAGAQAASRSAPPTARICKDYAEAIGPQTGAVLKVHTQQLRDPGLHRAVPTRELAALAHARGVPLVDDLGSGTLVDLRALRAAARADGRARRSPHGADLVTFSGDKLLGGPQAGLIVGRARARRADHARTR